MYPVLVLLNIYIVSVVTASLTVLVANNNGVHIIDPSSGENKTILPFGYGATSVTYHFERREIYSIIKSNQETQFSIIRTKIVETPQNPSCNREKLQEWCTTDGMCNDICSTNSSNPYAPELVLGIQNCFKANNLLLDWINNNLYWSCDPLSGNSQANLSSTLNMVSVEGLSSNTTLIRSKQIESVDIDPFDRKLFILENNVLEMRGLYGDSPITNYQLDNRNEKINRICVDSQTKTIYVVGQSKNGDNSFLDSLSYSGLKEITNYTRLYTFNDPSSGLGSKVVNYCCVIYWLRQPKDGWQLTNESEISGIETQIMHSLLGVNQWTVINIESQPLVNGTYCTRQGCSHGCYYSRWMQIICEYPPQLSLGPDNKTCQIQSVTERSKFEVTTKDPNESAVRSPSHHTELFAGTCQNATGIPRVVADSNRTIAIFLIVLTIMFILVFMLIVIRLAKRRANIGNYEIESSGVKIDVTLSNPLTRP